MLVDPYDAPASELLRDVEEAARAMGLQIQVLEASTSREINAAFATFVHERPDALYVGGGPFFNTRRIQLAILAARHLVPMTSTARAIAEVGWAELRVRRFGYDSSGRRLYLVRILKARSPPISQ